MFEMTVAFKQLIHANWITPKTLALVTPHMFVSQLILAQVKNILSVGLMAFTSNFTS